MLGIHSRFEKEDYVDAGAPVVALDRKPSLTILKCVQRCDRDKNDEAMAENEKVMILMVLCGVTGRSDWGFEYAYLKCVQQTNHCVCAKQQSNG